MEPFVSVIMPVRNERAYIERSLGAVLSQDYPATLMEIIVADGMSSDGTREILRQMAERDPRVRLLDNPRSTAPCALNLATEASRGDVVIRVDGHCEVAPDYVSRCVSHLLEDGVDGVGGCLVTVGEDERAKAIAAAMGSPFGVGGTTKSSPRIRTTSTTIGSERSGESSCWLPMSTHATTVGPISDRCRGSTTATGSSSPVCSGSTRGR
jgi:succinoglycan biosynthesis protein ExoA